MSDRQPPLRIRVAFEPNRFSAEHLIGVYEQLDPVKSQVIEPQPSAKQVKPKRVAVKEVQ